MAGLAIVIPRSGGLEPSVPKDLRLTDGSLILSYPGHSTDGWPSSLSLDGGTLLPNLAAEQAKALTGTSSDAAVSLEIGPHPAPSSSFLVERTAKGGLHVAGVSGSAPTLGTGLAIIASQALHSYLHSHASDDWYVSEWFRVSRASTSAADGGTRATEMAIGARTSFGNNYLAGSKIRPGLEQSMYPPVGHAARMGGSPDAQRNTTGTAYRVSVATTGFVGALPTLDQFQSTLFAVGAPAGVTGRPVLTGGNQAGNPALIHYGVYVENLTVSGRTYAEVDALDQQAWDIAFGAGGRYDGDTYTDPSTLP